MIRVSDNEISAFNSGLFYESSHSWTETDKYLLISHFLRFA